MRKKIIESIRIGETWTSYIACMYGVLTSSGLWKDDIWKLSGLSGMSFHFIIAEDICPSSVTVYDWTEEHYQMMDRIGVDSDVFSFWMDSSYNMYRNLQDRAIHRIKESIDREIGVTVWAPTNILEFGIIKGYDDNEQVFFVEDSTGKDTEHLLYYNLGFSEVSCLFYQIIYGRRNIELDSMVRSSLIYGVEEWKKEYSVNPKYAKGKKAYDILINALEKKKYDYFGLSYILTVYEDSKSSLARYLRWIAYEIQEFSSFEEPASLYKQVSDLFNKMSKIVPFILPNPKTEVGKEKLTDSETKEIVSLVKQCKEFESHAMKLIEKRVEE